MVELLEYLIIQVMPRLMVINALQQSGNAGGGLRTTNQTNGYWWNGADAFTVIMVKERMVIMVLVVMVMHILL